MRTFENLENRHMMTAALARDFVEINAGAQSPFGESVELDGVLFYDYGNNASGTELWRTDGTSEGTYLVRDLVPGNGGSNPQELFAIGDKVIFQTNFFNEFQDFGVWASDGTAEGTQELLDQSWRSPQRLGDRLLLFLSDNDEVWQTDGTLDGTKTIDLPPNDSTSLFGRSLVSESDESVLLIQGSSLFRIDTDLEPVEIAADFGSNAIDATIVGSDRLLYVQAGDFTSGSFLVENEVRVLDLDTGQSTRLISEPFPGFPSIQSSQLGNSTFFSTSSENDVLWKTDGTPEGTVQIPTDATASISSIDAVGDYVYVTTRGDEHETLWKVDEDSSSADVVLQVPRRNESEEFVGSLGLVPVGRGEESMYIFGVEEQVLWEVTEGEATELISDSLSVLNVLGELDGSLFLMANDSVHGYELWTYDRESGATELVKDANQSTADSFASPLGTINENLILSVFPSERNFNLDVELLSFDGSEYTQIGTMGTISPFTFRMLDDVGVYWRPRIDGDGEQIVELWATDGTESGTQMIYESGSFVPVGVPFVDVIDGIFYFQEDFTIWRSDGTAEGTFEVDAFPEQDTEPLSFPIEGGEYLVDPVEGGATIWFRDDSASSLAAQLRIVAEFPSLDLPEFLTIDSKLIVANAEFGGSTSVSVHAIDGLANEVVTLGEFPRSELASRFGTGVQLTELNGLVYFTGDDPFSGEELWVSDGTPEGTTIYDLWPGVSSSNPTNLVVFEDELYFSAADEAHGRELWKVSGEKPIAGDLNQDGDVNIHDYIFMTTNFAEEASRLEGDIDGDGIVGFSDFLLLQDNFGHRGDPPVARVG